MKLDLILKDIKDLIVRENFFRIKRQLEDQTILAGFWKFYEIDLPNAGTLIPIKHNLNFIPKDIISLSVVGNYNYYFNYNEFDSQFIYVTTSGPCIIRFLAGAYPSRLENS